MVKYSIFSFVILYVSIVHPVSSQINQDDLKARIIRDAEKMGKSFIKNDYEKFVLYMPSRALTKLGGKSQVISKMAKEEKMMKSQKIKFRQVNFGEPSDILEKNNTLQAVLPQMTLMSVPEGVLNSKGHLLAISYNNGESWSFLDVSTMNSRQVKSLVPNFNTMLEIPKWQEPQFVEN